MSWHEQAACLGRDPELWFPQPNDSAAAAKAICAGCPVRVECLDHALSTREPSGIWGGRTEAERDRLIRGRRIPRRLACELCAKPFTALSSSARFCSGACRQQRSRLVSV